MSLLEERDLVRLGRDAREWLQADERRLVIGLVVLSVAISIVMSLLATAMVGLVARRRAVGPDEPLVLEVTGEPLAAVEAPAGVPVMDFRDAPAATEVHVEA